MAANARHSSGLLAIRHEMSAALMNMQDVLEEAIPILPPNHLTILQPNHLTILQPNHLIIPHQIPSQHPLLTLPKTQETE
jgi:hypothetical protein